MKVLAGYLDEDRTLWAKPPNPDLDSEAARHDGVEAVLRSAVQVEGNPGVNVRVFTYDAGENTFGPRGPGSYLIPGVVPTDVEPTPQDVGLSPGRR